MAIVVRADTISDLRATFISIKRQTQRKNLETLGVT